MTKKHFEALAHELRSSRPPGGQYEAGTPESRIMLASMATWTQCVRAVADVCNRYNHQFDRARFLRAAGVE